MRKAGDLVDDDEMFSTIWKHLRSDGLPDQAANQLAAKMMTSEGGLDSSIETYERNYANFRERGFCDEAAQALAVETLETGNAPKESTRFARIYS
mgnify:FL=1